MVIETSEGSGNYQLRQIEMNMISVGSLALAPFVCETHR